MKQNVFACLSPSIAVLAAILIVGSAAVSAQWKETPLHQFGAADGRAPYGRLIADANGNLYGTTALGGALGKGNVFELANGGSTGIWTETVLYTFTGGSDGSQPYGGLIFDAAGNLYGTTLAGGASKFGTVYQLTPPAGGTGNWTQTVLHSFTGGGDGKAPQSDLILDHAGNLYGTTTKGGFPAIGVVFELTPPATPGGAWTETVLHRFPAKDGDSPRASVIMDSKGALYGTLANGGASGAGAVFRLVPPARPGGAWSAKTIYTFTGGVDGFGPLSRLVLWKGNVYGTTVTGGASGVGTVFELRPSANHQAPWTETVLHSFGCMSDGCYPWAGLIMDASGSFYGTTQFGGLPANGGTVFKLEQQGGVWNESVLFGFMEPLDQISASGLLFDAGGELYGTTIGDTMRAGMVFRLEHP